MTAIILCLLAFLAAFWAGRRSLAWGLLVVFGFGYIYGIARANILSTFSHFIFDAALVGLYLSQPWMSADNRERARSGSLRVWALLLILWPCLICLLPFQTFLISIVGLRGNVFFLPILILGTRLQSKDLVFLASGLAVLNILAGCMAGAEYFLGVERFFPESAVTSIIYSSRDVAGYTAFRIPSIFTSAHAYAGTMVMTLPLLFGAWTQKDLTGRLRQFMMVGIAVAGLGVLMASTRSHFVVLMVLAVSATLLASRASWTNRFIWILALVVLSGAAMTNERFQRFKQLSDTDMVMDRVSGSVNRTFWEILADYPMGNGLGGGGTSIPYFLQSQLRLPIAMESEYARILLEQGVIGLLLWVAFIVWFATRTTAFSKGSWRSSRWLAWLACLCYLATGMIGTGMLTSIPQTVLMLLWMGWLAVKPPVEAQILPVQRKMNLRDDRHLVVDVSHRYA